jgi:hypothetical protein
MRSTFGKIMTEDEAKELYGQYGLTAYLGQCLEMEAGTLLLSYISVGSKISREEAMNAIESSIDRQTFGALLKIIKEVVKFDDKSLDAVDEALSKRNHLVHHFFRIHAHNMLTADGRKSMISELEEIRTTFLYADTVLKSVTLALLKKKGHREEELNMMVEAESQRIATPNKPRHDNPS